MWHTLKTSTALTLGPSDIKPHEIVAPLTEIVFAPHPEFGTFWDVHYPVAVSLKREHVSPAINILRYIRRRNVAHLLRDSNIF